MAVCEIEKNSQERIRFDLVQFKGKPYADLRVYYDDGGEFKPSKKGLTLSPAVWSDFVQGIEKLSAELQAKGLLADPEEEEEAA